MEGKSNQRKFQEYLREKEKKNEPIDQSFAAKMKREMEKAMREEIKPTLRTQYDPSGGKLYREERHRNPDEEQYEYETEPAIKNLEKQIKDLAVARESLLSLIEKPTFAEDPIGGFTVTVQTDLSDLEKMKGKLLAQTQSAVDTLLKYNFDNVIPLFRLIKNIEDRITADNAILLEIRQKKSK